MADDDLSDGGLVGHLAELVAAFVVDEPGVEQVAPTMWRFPFTHDAGVFSVFVAAEGEVLLVSATLIDPVPTDRIAAVQELVLDLNSHLKLSWFDCHRSNGVLSARASLDTTDVAVTTVLIGNVVGAAVATMLRFRSAIDAVAAGELDPADLRDAPDPATGRVIRVDSAAPGDIDRVIAELLDGP